MIIKSVETEYTRVKREFSELTVSAPEVSVCGFILGATIE